MEAIDMFANEVPAESSCPKETAAEHYAQMWVFYREELEKARALLSTAVAKDREWRQIHAPGFESLPGINDALALYSAAETITDNLINLARETYAVPGTELEIDRTKYHELAGLEDPCSYASSGSRYLEFDPDRFDPCAIWRALEQEFGGSKAADLVYAKAAVEIARAFGLKHTQPHFRSGKLVLDRRVTTEPSFDGKVRKLSYHSMELMSGIFSSLAIFAIWGGEESLSEWFKAQSDHWYRGGYPPVTSREKSACAGFVYTTMYQRFEFTMTRELAERFQTFVSLYAADYLNDC